MPFDDTHAAAAPRHRHARGQPHDTTAHHDDHG
jgi:hypothetical protein